MAITVRRMLKVGEAADVVARLVLPALLQPGLGLLATGLHASARRRPGPAPLGSCGWLMLPAAAKLVAGLRVWLHGSARAAIAAPAVLPAPLLWAGAWAATLPLLAGGLQGRLWFSALKLRGCPLRLAVPRVAKV